MKRNFIARLINSLDKFERFVQLEYACGITTFIFELQETQLKLHSI